MSHNKQYVSVYSHFGRVYEVFRHSGKKFIEEVQNFEYEFFIEDREGNGKFRDVVTQEKSLKALKFKTPKLMKEKLTQLKDIGFEPYSTANAENQFRFKEYYQDNGTKPLHMMFFDIETGFNGSFLGEDGELIYGDGAFSKPEHANSSITTIVLYSSFKKKYYGFGMKDFSPVDNVKYKKCKSERDIIESFLKTVEVLQGDLLSGWGADTFDFPFVVNRMKALGIPLKLIDMHLNKPRNKSLETSFEKPKSYYWMDYLELYKKFIFKPREKYSLDHIAGEELGQGKLDYMNDHTNLEHLYRDDFQKYMEYNVKDVELMVLLDDKLKLMDLSVQLSYLYNINVGDVFGTVFPWGQKMYCESYMRGMCLPRDFKYRNESMDFEGGWVMAHPGFYRWIMSFDFASLYPSIIRSFNLCPSKVVPDNLLSPALRDIQSTYYKDREASYSSITKIIERDNKTNVEIQAVLEEECVSLSPTGDFFKVDSNGFVPEIIENVYQDRKKAKGKMLEHQRIKQKLIDSNGSPEEIERETALEAMFNNEQQALKIALNSLFGALANNMFVLFNKQIARSITSCGRLYDRYCALEVKKVLTKKFKPDFDPLFQADTDSFYISVSFIVDKLIEEGKVGKDLHEITTYIAENIEPIIQKINANSLQHLNTSYNVIRPEVMELDREVIASTGLSNGKKNYAMNVLDSEGTVYEHGYPKVVGLQLKKTNIPGFIRKELKIFLDDMLKGTEDVFQNRYSSYKSGYTKFTSEDIGFPKGCNIFSEAKQRMYVLGDKGLPIHVRSALLYNEYIKDVDESKHYQPIETGNKIKFIYLKTPNPIGHNVIGWPNNRDHTGFIEAEGLDKFIDYKLSFQNNVHKPLEELVNNRGWSFQKRNSLF